MYKEFVIGDVFEKVSTKKIRGKANDFPLQPNDGYKIPLLTAGIENQGLSRYAKECQCDTILSNVISISANGANSGVVFYQSEPFAVLQDAYAVKVRNYEIENSQIGLYLVSCLNKAIRENHDWNYKAGWNRIKNDILTLPVITDENEQPIKDDNFFYHKEGYMPDWKFMREYILEIEKNKMKEIEKFLVSVDLDNCSLTDDDKTVLEHKFIDVNQTENLTSNEKCYKKIDSFRIGDLFYKINPKYYGRPNTYVGRKSHTKTIPDKFHTVPLTCAKYDNNGVMYYGEEGLFESISNCLVMIRDGAVSTGLVFAHKEPVGVLSHSYLMKCKEEVDFKALLYVSSIMTKTLYPKYNRGDPSVWENKVENDYIFLPVDSKGLPDWDFMRKYIVAIEKLVIKSVIEWKDKNIKI